MTPSHNNHHFRWNRAWWESEHYARRIRQFGGMILRLPIVPHNELHEEIPPIKPPYRNLGLIELNHLHSLETVDPLVVIPWHADFLWQLAEEDSRIGHEAFKQADHLEQQIAFLGLRNAIA